MAVAVILTLGGGAVFAQDQAINSESARYTAGNGWYLGASLGQSYINLNDVCSRNLQPLYTSGFSCSTKNAAVGLRLFAGYQIIENLAVEGGYVDLGQGSVSSAGNVGITPSTADLTLKSNGLAADVILTLPITHEFGVFGRLGTFFWEVAETPNASGGLVANGNQSSSGASFDFGIGAKYDFDSKTGIRAEYQLFKNVGDPNTTGRGDIGLISASLLYRFN